MDAKDRAKYIHSVSSAALKPAEPQSVTRMQDRKTEIHSEYQESVFAAGLPDWVLLRLWWSTFDNVVPLSQTSPEKIEAIRDWGRERAVPASGRPIGTESLSGMKKNGSKMRKVLI